MPSEPASAEKMYGALIGLIQVVRIMSDHPGTLKEKQIEGHMKIAIHAAEAFRPFEAEESNAV